ASFALRDAGFETVMINCNPETVSTDYDTSDRLYFEPLTREDVLNVLEAEIAAGPVHGVIVSLGGQTPLKLSHDLPPELVLGTSPASIDLAEDRERFNQLCDRLAIAQPPGGMAVDAASARRVAAEIGYPVLVRPSYVLGGRAMQIVYDADAQLAWLWGIPEEEVRASRTAAGVTVTFKTVDTCAAEFAARTPYHYSTWEDDDEVAPLERPAVIILGSGPNRIGQGIEFDYCCVHAAFELSAAGFETVMVNCNPETVSTDYDTSDRLFFEPLTPEDVLHVCGALADNLRGVIVSLGGQTPLKLAHDLEAAGVPVLGTSPDSIDLAEDRERFNALCERLGIPQPPGGVSTGVDGAVAVANRVEYPVLVRPSYVLGGRAMEIVYDEAGLRSAMAALAASTEGGAGGGLSATRPVLIDRFLEDATEVDVDAVRDTSGEVLIGGVMEHIEEAGVHSGDSACAIPPPTLSGDVVTVIANHTRALADALGVVGVINVQYAVKDGTVYILEANPRASRTVPFVSKATAVPLAKVAARLMVGATLAELRAEGLIPANAGADGGGHVAVKEAALPFDRFGVDTLLGPEMRSTGEVMGIDRTFGVAFAKSQTAVGNKLPDRGSVFLSLADRDKPAGLTAARRFADLGFTLVATAGTAAACEADGLPIGAVVAKLGPGERREPDADGVVVGVDAVDLIASGKVNLVVNTPRGRGPRADGAHIRLAASAHGVPCLTTVAAALAAAAGIAEWRTDEHRVRSLQEYHRDAQLRLPL
ncbi:MAG TPA: carbamoyl-phosphate synthase large subunit, partial [Acidimicrobiia bacterium]|nr:carbamoyl-phosphate synthase large subunit [Acidimicrobiia bacterium]